MGTRGTVTAGVSGSIGGSINVEWTQSHERGNGYSDINIKVIYKGTTPYGGTYYCASSGQIKVNGETVYGWLQDNNVPIPDSGTHLAAEKTVRVFHTGVTAIAITIDGGHGWNSTYGSLSIDWPTTSEQVTLEAIPQRHTLSLAVGTGGTLTVTRDGAALTSGAEIFDGEILTVTGTVSTGRTMKLTINGSAISGVATITVTGDINVVLTTGWLGTARIGEKRYIIYVGTGTGKQRIRGLIGPPGGGKGTPTI